MEKVILNPLDLQERLKRINNSLHLNLKKFRELDPNKYSFKMYDYFLSVSDLETTTHTILNSLLAAKFINRNLKDYSIIYDHYNYENLVHDLYDLTKDYTNLLEYIICVKKDMTYKMKYAQSTYNSGYIISTEVLDATINDFYKMVEYLKEKGVKYEVN